MKHASLFSGLGGFDLAAQWLGWSNIFHSEIDPFCNKILNYHFPNSISYGNIKETSFIKHRGEVDILTGGFPCQPFSVAGKRNGTDDSRYLWPEMLRAIQEIRPRWIVAENVRGLLTWNEGLVFDTVCSDMENEGYEVLPFLLPACGVNAPHRRERIWIIAYLQIEYDRRSTLKQTKRQKQQFGESSNQNIITNTKCFRRYKIFKEVKSKQPNGIKPYSFGFQQSFTYSKSKQSKRMQFEQCEACKQKQGKSGGGNSQSCSKRELEYWRKFPTQSPICSRNDGLSSLLDGITFSKWRSESVKGYGNAIVPQVALQIFKAIEEFNQKIK